MIYRLSHLRERMMIATGCSRWQAEKAEHWFLNELTEVLSRGDTIQIHEFGTFSIRNSRIQNSIFGRDPVTKKRFYIGKEKESRRARVLFRASGRLRENVKALLKNQS